MAEKETIGEIDVTGWSEADKAALRTALGAQAEAESALSTAEAAREAAARSPAALIAAAQEAAQLARGRALALAELEKAEAKHGKKRVILVPTAEGGVVLRAMTLAEMDTIAARADQLQGTERTAIHREGLLETVVFPGQAEVRAHLEKYPGDWGTFYVARDLLITDVTADHLGKAAASLRMPAAT